MKDNRAFTQKKNIKTYLRIAVFILLIAVLGLFALLIKARGNISYIYNNFAKTRGSLPVESADRLPDTRYVLPHATDETDPDRHIRYTRIRLNDSPVESYTRSTPINTDYESDILQDNVCSENRIGGILTYRGSYTRNTLSYGEPLSSADRLNISWEYKTGRFLKDDGINYWSGNGWTGQPLAVCWTEEWKKRMNLYPEALIKDDLVEIIYPGMDGRIHFLDMETGLETRDSINVGMIFKGTCTLHPDYPLLICGSGDSAIGLFGEQVCARVFIYSLIDGTKLYEFAANDDMATRSWHGFDSSPIIDAASDTVIFPGENGVLYTLHLNTKYDEASGRLTVSPDETVKYAFMSYAADIRYEASEYCNGSGSESSAAIWRNYLFFGDNGGIFQCLDLDTMKPVWVQDLLEDINSSPVLESEDDGQMYIYVGTTLKYGYDAHHTGEACIYKLSAMTGEIIWKKPYEVHTMNGYAGGILSSGASGKGSIEDYIFYAVSKTPSVDTGYIVALSKKTGEEYWRIELKCDAWSSGVIVYCGDGSARLIQCCGNGDVLLIDAESGRIIDSVNFGANIEATPVIAGDRLAVGLRSEYIAGIRILADSDEINNNFPVYNHRRGTSKETEYDGVVIGGVASFMPDSSADMFLKNYFDIDSGQYISYKTFGDALTSLDNGVTDAVWATDITAEYLESTGDYEYYFPNESPGLGQVRFRFGFAFDRKNEVLRDQANAFLAGEDVTPSAKGGRLYIGVTGAVPPLEFVDSDGEVSGAACELAARFASRLGLEPVFIVLTNENALVELLAGRVDMLAAYGTSENHSLNIPKYIMSDGYRDIYGYCLIKRRSSD